MKHNTLFSILATAAFGIVIAGPVSASVIDWNGKGTDWATAANWVGGVVPGSGDTAKFPAVYVSGSNEPFVSTAHATVGRVVLASGHTITVTGKTLTLAGTTAHDIDGELRLSDSTAVLKFSASVTVDGDGNIIGQDDSAKILIVGGKTLTNEMVIRGRMTIDDPIGATAGTFNNGDTGVVRANDNGVLSFASGLTLADGTACSPSWESITDAGAVLEFNEAATNLVGTFVLDDCAKMRFNVNITTAGKLVDSSAGSPQGFIDIENSSTFTFRTVCDGGSPVSYTTDQTLGSCP